MNPPSPAMAEPLALRSVQCRNILGYTAPDICISHHVRKTSGHRPHKTLLFIQSSLILALFLVAIPHSTGRASNLRRELGDANDIGRRRSLQAGTIQQHELIGQVLSNCSIITETGKSKAKLDSSSVQDVEIHMQEGNVNNNASKKRKKKRKKKSIGSVRRDAHRLSSKEVKKMMKEHSMPYRADAFRVDYNRARTHPPKNN